LNAQNNFYTFLKLAAILQKGKNRFAKKKSGPELYTPARPAQTRGRTGTPPSDPDRMARGLLPRAISHAGEAALES
jgi:hypothetical protein